MARYNMTPGTTGYTLEEFDFAADCLQIELEINYEVEPYDPGYRYNKNGDGCPPSGGGVEDFTIKVKSAQGELTDYFGADLAAIETAANVRIDADPDLAAKIRDHCDWHVGDRWSGGDDGRDPDAQREERAERQHEERQRYSEWHGSVAGVS